MKCVVANFPSVDYSCRRFLEDKGVLGAKEQ